MHSLIILLALLGTSTDVRKSKHGKGKGRYQRPRNWSSASTALPEPELTDYENQQKVEKEESLALQERIYNNELSDEELEQYFDTEESFMQLMNLANHPHEIFVLMALIDTYPWETFLVLQGEFKALMCTRDVSNRIIKRFLETGNERIQTMILEEFGLQDLDKKLEQFRTYLTVNILENVENEDIAQYVFIFALQKMLYDYSWNKKTLYYQYGRLWLSAIIRCIYKHPNLRELSIRKTRIYEETDELEMYSSPLSILCHIFGHQYVLRVSEKMRDNPRHLSRREREKGKTLDLMENASTALETASHISEDPHPWSFNHETELVYQPEFSWVSNLDESWEDYPHQYIQNWGNYPHYEEDNYQHQYGGGEFAYFP
jgi:hypothetical protein